MYYELSCTAVHDQREVLSRGSCRQEPWMTAEQLLESLSLALQLASSLCFIMHGEQVAQVFEGNKLSSLNMHGPVEV